MSHVRNRDIAAMSREALEARLLELRTNFSNYKPRKRWVGPLPIWVPTKQLDEV